MTAFPALELRSDNSPIVDPMGRLSLTKKFSAEPPFSRKHLLSDETKSTNTIVHIQRFTIIFIVQHCFYLKARRKNI